MGAPPTGSLTSWPAEAFHSGLLQRIPSVTPQANYLVLDTVRLRGPINHHRIVMHCWRTHVAPRAGSGPQIARTACATRRTCSEVAYDHAVFVQFRSRRPVARLRAAARPAGSARIPPSPRNCQTMRSRLGDEPLDLSTPLPESARKTPKRPPPGASLERPLETKLGVNYRKSPIPNAEFQPDPFIRNGLVDTGASPESTGVAWAHVTAPQLPLGWDTASIETQLDPLDEQGKLSGTLSRSLALGDEIAVTVRNGYSTERTFSNGARHRLAHLGHQPVVAAQPAADRHHAVARCQSLERRRPMAAHVQRRAEAVWRAVQPQRRGERDDRTATRQEPPGRLQAELVGNVDGRSLHPLAAARRHVAGSGKYRHNDTMGGRNQQYAVVGHGELIALRVRNLCRVTRSGTAWVATVTGSTVPISAFRFATGARPSAPDRSPDAGRPAAP